MTIRHPAQHPIHQILDHQYRRCLAPTRHSRIRTRWADEPALAGLSIPAIIDTCADATVDQNPIVRALLRLHQHGDADATTMLMVALRPSVSRVAQSFSAHRHQDDAYSTLWAAAGHLLATTDAELDPRDEAGEPRVLLSFLATRLRASYRLLDTDDRNQNRRYRRGQLPTIVALDPGVHDTAGGNVENQAVAMYELHRVADAVNNGVIGQARWKQLVHHRLSTQPSTPAIRVGAHRAASQLAVLVGHEAA